MRRRRRTGKVTGPKVAPIDRPIRRIAPAVASEPQPAPAELSFMPAGPRARPWGNSTVMPTIVLLTLRLAAQQLLAEPDLAASADGDEKRLGTRVKWLWLRSRFDLADEAFSCIGHPERSNRGDADRGVCDPIDCDATIGAVDLEGHGRADLEEPFKLFNPVVAIGGIGRPP